MMTSPPVRVLTVDGLLLVHAGLRELLRPFPDIELTGHALSVGDAVRQFADGSCDVVLVETDDLGPNWPATLAQFVRAMGTAHVVPFTTHISAEHVRLALRSGVHGFLLKHMAPLSLAHALRSLAAGQRVFAPEATSAMAALPPEEPAPGWDLSQREREVLTLLASGLSNDEISRRLCVSRATVKFHCTNIFGKLGVRTRAQAVALAHKHQLVPRVIVENDLAPVAHRRLVGDVVARGA